MGILVALFQVWLVMLAIMLVLVLPVMMLGALARGTVEAVSEVLPRRCYADDKRPAPAPLKPQRIVFWWLPHDQGP